MTPLAGVMIECHHPVATYSEDQLAEACQITWALQRGLFVLISQPALADYAMARCTSCDTLSDARQIGVVPQGWIRQADAYWCPECRRLI